MACVDYFDNGIFMDGVASWFCCGSAYSPFCGSAGGGACGSCDSHSYHCAWPYLSGFSPSNYASTCRPDLPQFSCGNQFYVVDYCGGPTGICVTIKDHGPNTDNYCTNDPCSSVHCSGRIIDLSPAAFMQVSYMAQGITEVQVWSNPC